MKKLFVALGIPSLGTISMHWAASFSDLCWPMNYGVAKFFVLGKAVAEARNEIVARALAWATGDDEITHLFFLDDDVLVGRSALPTLMSRHVPIVSGVYFNKGSACEPLIFPASLGGTDPFIPDRFYRVWGHGMGLTLIRMEVFRRMRDELDLGQDEFGNPMWFRTIRHESFLCGKHEAALNQSEDLYFCELAEKLDIPRYIDTSRAAFGWHFDRHSQVGYPIQQWREYHDTDQMTWQTPDGQQVVWKR